jgi:hypothetical protein
MQTVVPSIHATIPRKETNPSTPSPTVIPFELVTSKVLFLHRTLNGSKHHWPYIILLDNNGHNSAFVLCMLGLPGIRMSYLMVFWYEWTSLRSFREGNVSVICRDLMPIYLSHVRVYESSIVDKVNYSMEYTPESVNTGCSIVWNEI